MNGFALVLVTAALGVDYGWQPSSDGRLEYIIQLEPVTLIALREGQEVLSQIDPYVKDVRRFRITVGTGMVQRVGSPSTASQYGSAGKWTPPAGVTYGWQPVDAQRLEFIIQLSPERIVLLKSGEDIVGEIPAECGNVGRFRIRSAADQLPRQGLAGFHGAASYEAPAGTAPNGPAGQAVTAAPVGQANGTQAFSPGVGTAASSTPAFTGATGAQSPATAPPQMGPAVAGPPRMTEPGAPTGIRAAGPTLQGSDPRLQPFKAPAGRFQAGNAPLQGASTPSQPDPRSVYAQSSGQPGGTGYAPPVSDSAPVRGNSWPPPSNPADNSAGWSTTVDNAQSWPPPANQTVQGTGQASAGASSGWDPRTAPSSSYSGGQFQGGAPPLQSTEQIPPAGPTYSPPYVASGPVAGRNDQPLAGADSGYSPFARPSPPASQTSAGFGARPAYSSSRPPQPPGSDMVSIVSLGSKPPRKAGPMDFWTSLAETANDPDLAYLRDDVYTADAEKAWWPLTLAMLALFASMGGNLYMGWIAVDVYRRYLDVAADEYDEDDDYTSSDRDEDREEDWASERRRRRAHVPASGRAVA